MPTIPVWYRERRQGQEDRGERVGRPSTASTLRQSRWNRETGGLYSGPPPGRRPRCDRYGCPGERGGSHAIQILASRGGRRRHPPGLVGPRRCASRHDVDERRVANVCVDWSFDVQPGRHALRRRRPERGDLRALISGKVSSAAPGAADVEGIDQKIAALASTDAAQITITDLAIRNEERISLSDARPGHGRHGGALPRRWRRKDRSRFVRRDEIRAGRAAESAGGDACGSPQPAPAV